MYVPVHPDDTNALDRYHVETHSANGRHPNHYSIFRLLHDLQVQELMASLCTFDQCQYCEDVSVLVVVEDEDMVYTPEKSLVVALEPYKVASAEREAVVRLPVGESGLPSPLDRPVLEQRWILCRFTVIILVCQSEMTTPSRCRVEVPGASRNSIAIINWVG
jgi:hypothetical protein